ncbi:MULTISPECIES: 3'-5' exonuclease [Brachymonas]|uniref:3'-5' exonuclease n=1 Tax=Brachymonas TaxID=28219 RepID=UPI00168E6D61|nr:3'-5' exonuclease [Brachymonas sp. J145]MEE1652602.1 3'-5' exonuclease [Brachymonas sp. J145]NLX15483.1 exonuclease domain-containing protein [Ramlibacter sp.]
MILVIDLEATCEEHQSGIADMEIIEVGACWATPDGTVRDTFQRFVRPVQKPLLSNFCRELTRISQQDVDTAACWPEVAAELADFASLHAVPEPIWASWGQYDARQILRDCQQHQTPHPLAGWQHLNLKAAFAQRRGIRQTGMGTALQLVGLVLEGQHHRALADAMNTAKLLPFSLPLPT